MAANYFRQSLVRIGFTQEAAATMVNPGEEALELESLGLFDDDAIKQLCQSLRKPGGQIAGPVPANTPPGAAPPMITNPGVPVSALAEVNLKVAAYMVKHFNRTTRTLQAAFIDDATIRRYTLYKRAEKEHKEPDDIMKPDKVEKVWDFIEEWPEHLALYNGQDGRPLNYIIRSEVAVPNANDDPTFGTPNYIYSSMRDEVAARSGHTAPHYQIDNARVFELL
jgi:hypothetical protein